MSLVSQNHVVVVLVEADGGGCGGHEHHSTSKGRRPLSLCLLCLALFVCLSVSIIMCDVGMQFCMSRMDQRRHHSMSILQSLQL